MGSGALAPLHGGLIQERPGSGASCALADLLLGLWAEEFPGQEPRRVQFGMDDDAFFARLGAVRARLHAHPRALVLARGVVEALGLDPAHTWIDRPRFRAVKSGGHRLARARPAYHIHRDTWYANPPAQVNAWIAVDDVAPEEAFAIFPAYFDVPIANDSDRFDYAAWQAQGGWQHEHPAKVYPTALAEPGGPRVQIAMPRGGVLLFSSTHLHGTWPHDSGRTRFSAELRLFAEEDLIPLKAARRLDSRARGTTVGDFVRASDFTPFPTAAVRAYEAAP